MGADRGGQTKANEEQREEDGSHKTERPGKDVGLRRVNPPVSGGRKRNVLIRCVGESSCVVHVAP